MKSQFIFGLAIMIFVPLAGNKLTIALAQEIQVFEDAGVKFGAATWWYTHTAAVGDVDNDGDLDVGLGNHCYYDSIYMNLGENQFVMGSYPIGGWGNPHEAIFADMDGDGDLDFLTGSSSGLDNGHIVISINDGTGVFTTGPWLREWGSSPESCSYVVGDFTGDGLPDIVTSNVLLLNQGGLTFAPIPAPGLVTENFSSMAAADVDLDGDLDISVWGKIWLNDGGGHFVDSGQLLLIGSNGDTFADFNRDGAPDLLTSNTFQDYLHGRNVIYLNDGQGNFYELQDLGSERVYSYAVGDFNNDGWVDMLIVSMWPKIKVYLNDGTGIMIGPVQTIDMKSYEVAVGDMNNDGWVDLVVPQIGYDRTNHLWLNMLGEYKIEVEIDIKPGSYPNAINLGSSGLIPVAILSSADFNATTVDPDTIELAGAGVEMRGKSNKYMAHEEDVNGDGLVDLVVQVATENLDPDSFQDGIVFLTGETYDGQAIQGQDEITIVPPKQ